MMEESLGGREGVALLALVGVAGVGVMTKSRTTSDAIACIDEGGRLARAYATPPKA